MGRFASNSNSPHILHANHTGQNCNLDQKAHEVKLRIATKEMEISASVPGRWDIDAQNKKASILRKNSGAKIAKSPNIRCLGTRGISVVIIRGIALVVY
jgi:hypothetical protein